MAEKSFIATDLTFFFTGRVLVKSIKNLHLATLLLCLLTAAQFVGMALAQKPEEVARGIPWFIGMIVVIVIVAIVAGLRQKMKK